MSLETKGRKAVLRYLKLKGYDVLDEEFDGFIVAFNYDGLHIIDASVTEKYDVKPQVNKSREDYEQVMCKWLASHDDYLDVEVYPDACNLIVLGNNRALVKHYVNVQELV